MLKFATLVAGNQTPLSYTFVKLKVFAKAHRRPSVTGWGGVTLRQFLLLARFMSHRQVFQPNQTVLMGKLVLRVRLIDTGWGDHNCNFILCLFVCTAYVLRSPYRHGLGRP